MLWSQATRYEMLTSAVTGLWKRFVMGSGRKVALCPSLVLRWQICLLSPYVQAESVFCSFALRAFLFTPRNNMLTQNTLHNSWFQRWKEILLS